MPSRYAWFATGNDHLCGFGAFLGVGRAHVADARCPGEFDVLDHVGVGRDQVEAALPIAPFQALDEGGSVARALNYAQMVDERARRLVGLRVELYPLE